ncbi:MAG TPA: hypothetical protein VEA41_19175 [Salinarimonas sp.]|nr:hypothetical protein [Salinarimonas sp.]
MTILTRLIRALGHRRAVRSMTDLSDHSLADIGLLRTDVHAALGRSYLGDPSRILKDACCHWRTFASRFRPSSDPVACC